MPCRTKEEVWSQETRGQVVMVKEDHWEEMEILKRALEFHKIGSWNRDSSQEEESNFILAFQKRQSPVELSYIHSSLLFESIFTFMNWLQVVFPTEQTSFNLMDRACLSCTCVFKGLPVTLRTRCRSGEWKCWLM